MKTGCFANAQHDGQQMLKWQGKHPRPHPTRHSEGDKAAEESHMKTSCFTPPGMAEFPTLGQLLVPESAVPAKYQAVVHVVPRRGTNSTKAWYCWYHALVPPRSRPRQHRVCPRRQRQWSGGDKAYPRRSISKALIVRKCVGAKFPPLGRERPPGCRPRRSLSRRLHCTPAGELAPYPEVVASEGQAAAYERRQYVGHLGSRAAPGAGVQ